VNDYFMSMKKASRAGKLKLKVIQYADKNEKQATARIFDVDLKCVHPWYNQKEALLKAMKDKHALWGKKCTYPKVEETLFWYVTGIRRLGYSISTEVIQIEAIKIARSRNIPVQEFKGSYSWSHCFILRHGHLIMRRTTISQKLPEEYANKIMSFHRYMIAVRKMNSILLSHIGNVNQTPMWFYMRQCDSEYDR
jgi:hypothetical protein